MFSLFEPEMHYCPRCDTVLFDAAERFESGMGWPSFIQPPAILHERCRAADSLQDVNPDSLDSNKSRTWHCSAREGRRAPETVQPVTKWAERTTRDGSAGLMCPSVRPIEPAMRGPRMDPQSTVFP